METTVETSNRTKPNKLGFTVNDVIEKINQSLIDASKTLEKENIKLESATVNLMTTNDLSVSGGFSLALKASAKWQRQASNSVTYNFVPVQSSIDTLTVSSRVLTEAIENAAINFGQLLAIPTLKKKSFEVELSVAIIVGVEGGIEFKISETGFDLVARFERTVFHKINLTFGPSNKVL